MLAALIDGSPYPIYLILGDELIVTVANAATLKAWGKDKSVIGKSFSEAIPELEGQPFEGLLKSVMATGEPYYAVNDRATFLMDGEHQDFYFSFSYQPLADAQGKIIGVLCYATDVTGLVESARKIEQLAEEAIQTNKQLESINKELESSNEELETTNQELTESYHLLELSELRFKNIIQQAPFSICVIRASDLIVTDVNDRYLELVGKERKQLDGQSIWHGVPEAAAQYAPILQGVINSKIAFIANQAEVYLLRQGKIELMYLDFIFEPVLDLQGEVSAIMVVVIDVSQQVHAKKAIEEVEERIRLAVEAAEIGTYEYRFATDVLITSDRFNEIVKLDQGFSREELIQYFQPKQSAENPEHLDEAIRNGKMSYELKLVHPDLPIKWLKLQTKVYFNTLGRPERSLGTVIDISQFKALQQQKDDFITIASHELKTPITTLKASLQMLIKMKNHINPVVFPKLLNQASRSMDKISNLVDDLLNVSKMSQGKLNLKKEKFKVLDLFEKCCDHVYDAQKLIINHREDLNISVFADIHQIEQVVINLINNALKYAPESNHIILDAIKTKDMVKISVTDTGPGIPAEDIPKLFDRYYRVENSAQNVAGLGLGLYICSDIVKRHHGEFGVESTVGIGSSFWFTLPL